ncbi:MAG: hypothetical protein M1822_008318 [Bathelium mastoideum]|nr:MAG: hypothetical protein M1822_008318 [Bathelium mastoideum]
MALKRQLEELAASLEQHTDIIERLRSAPEPEANAILSRIRSTTDVSHALSPIQTGASPNRLSERQIARGVLPATDGEIEFELVVRHKIIYPALTPINVFSLDLDNLARPGSGSLSPEISPAGSITEQNAIPSTIEDGTIDPSLLIAERYSPLRGSPAKRSFAASGPSQPSQYCDARLQGLDLRFGPRSQ